MLSDPTCRYLLALARTTLAEHLGAPVDPLPAIDTVREEIQKPRGAFVSLHTRADRALRGCIGTFAFERTLEQNIREMAVAAGCNDPRFAPVSLEELAGLAFEISAMKPPSPIAAEAVVVGTHGLLVSRGRMRGVLLPQVPVEWRWSRDEFLAQTCRKAGLPSDAWRDPDVVLHAFTAHVFHE